MEKQLALDIQRHGLNAIVELTRALDTAFGRCSEEEYNAVKRGVGSCIGQVQMEVLEILYLQHPDIDPLIET